MLFIEDKDGDLVNLERVKQIFVDTEGTNDEDAATVIARYNRDESTNLFVGCFKEANSYMYDLKVQLSRSTSSTSRFIIVENPNE
jgi:hypothetical protein